MKRRLQALCWLLGMASLMASADDTQLIVVEDRGGVSALLYYQALDLPPMDAPVRPPMRDEEPVAPTQPFSEADMLPAKSALLSPGRVERRSVQAPGLRPLFLVGDDEYSHAWLRRRADNLQALGAAGLVVNVETAEDLANLRRLVPCLSLSPVSADELARRLGLNHYPVLVTATGIEQ